MSYTIPRAVPALDVNDDDQTLGTTSVSPGSKPYAAKFWMVRLQLFGMCQTEDGVVYLPQLSEDIKVCASTV